MEESSNVFRLHFKIWRTWIPIYQLKSDRKILVYLHMVYAVVYHLTYSVLFQLSMIFGLLMQKNGHDILNNLTYLFTSILVPLKLFSIFLHRNDITLILKTSRHFDEQAGGCELQLGNINAFKRKSFVISMMYIGVYGAASFFSGISPFFYTERRLVFPGYFPYDWRDPNNDVLYVMTLAYQVIGFTVHAVANMLQDTFPGFLMYLLAVHADNLKLRISRIGHNTEKELEKNHAELRVAIKDYKALVVLFKLVRDTSSVGLFGQILVTSLNIVITVVMYMYFTEDLAEGNLYLCMGSAYVMEIVLASYFGSVASLALEGISEGIYSCNWAAQSHAFRKDLKIFMEVSLTSYEFVAGGLISVNLKSFACIMKSTYSLFALLERMGDRLKV